jgi:hypothetical protein
MKKIYMLLIICLYAGCGNKQIRLNDASVSGIVPVDSFFANDFPAISRYAIDHDYYTVAMTNDSLMLETNGPTSASKISYVHLPTGTIIGKGHYAYLPDDRPEGWMVKTPNTRKAYVRSAYVTENYIYPMPYKIIKR